MDGKHTASGHYPVAFKVLRPLAYILSMLFMLSAISLPVAPLLAQPEPHISVTPDRGTVGSVVTIKGTGFLSPYPVTVTMDTFVVAPRVTVTGEGTFSLATEIPGLPYGPKTVTATAAEGKISATASFTVVSHIVVTPGSGVPASTVAIAGSGFPASSPISIAIDNNPVAKGTADSSGRFSASGRVPLLPPGEKRVTATAESRAGPVSASASFNIVGPQISVTPSSGPPGSTVAIQGKGFPASSPVTVTIGGSVVASGIVATGDGAFATSGTVPRLPAGSKEVVATADRLSASTLFELTPLAERPVEGRPDLTVSATDAWFEDDGRVLVLYAEIVNRGTAAAPGTLVSFAERAGAWPASMTSIPSLGASETAEREVRLEIPEQRRGTTYFFSVEVDPGNNVPEINEGNNQGAITIDVTVDSQVIESEVIEPQVVDQRWWIVVILVAAGAITAFIRWPRPKIAIRPKKDSGTQEIETDTAATPDYEIRLRAVADPGKQEIEAVGPLIVDERRERHEQ